MPSVVRCGLVLVAFLLTLSCSSAPPVPEGIHDRRNQSSNLLKLGRQAFQEARYDQALSFFENAATVSTSVDDEVGMAVAWNSVAAAQLSLGKLGDAQNSLVIALQMAQVTQRKDILLQVAANRVQAALAAGKLDDAKSILDGLGSFPDTVEGAALWYARALVLKSKNESQLALESVAKASALHGTLKLKAEQAADLFLKATILGHDGKWAEAKTELQSALLLDRMEENTMGLGQDWRALGTVYLKLNDLEASRDSLERSQRIFKAAGLLDQQKRSLELLLPVLKALGKNDEADRVQGLLSTPATTP